MIEVSSFLSGKNLCNIFADLLVKKINEESPDAKTQITVINVRNFFIVKGVTTSDKIINPSEILTNLFESYDEELVDKVRIIDTILYNKPFELNLHIDHSENKNQNKIKKELSVICNDLQKEGFYITVKLSNGVLFYDFERPKDFDPLYIKSKFKDYVCIKDDFSQDTYYSDTIFGLSNDGLKYYYFLLNKVSFNLLNRGFAGELKMSLSSELNIKDIDSDNVRLQINGKTSVDNDKLKSLVLDNFDFTLYGLQNQFDLTTLDVLSSLSNNSGYGWDIYLSKLIRLLGTSCLGPVS
jgi:hypothetical protein